jgi:hypothetical protein
MKRFPFIILFLLFLCPSAWATSWYCSTQAVVSGQSAPHDGSSWDHAWTCDSNSTNPVLWGTSGAKVKPGDTLYIDGGPSGLTYTATADALLYVQASGTDNTTNRITIATGAKSPLPSQHDGKVTFDGSGTYSNIISNGQAYITFDGKKAQTCSDFKDCINWKIYNTRMPGGYVAVNLAGSQYVLFTYIEIEKCNSAIYQRGGSPQIGGEFSYLYIHDLRGYGGISLQGTNVGETSYDLTLVHHSTIEINSHMNGTGPGADGIQGCAGLTAYNNTISHVLGDQDEDYPGACNFPSASCNPPTAGFCCVEHSDEIQASAEYIKAYNNIFKNPTDSGFDVDCLGACGHYYIYNNLFYSDSTLSNSAGQPIRFYGNSGPITSWTEVYIFNNTFVDVLGARTISLNATGGESATVSDVHFENNLIYNCGQVGAQAAIHIFPSDQAVPADWGVDYNLVWAGLHGSNIIAVDSDNPYTQPNGYINVQPVFVSYTEKTPGNNFHLTASYTGANLTSFCNSMPGITATKDACKADKDGNPRPASGSWDRGAYQYGSGFATPTIGRGVTIGGGVTFK